MRDGSLLSWTWFAAALALFAIEGVRPGRFALWLGFAAVLVGVIASVARWPWPVIGATDVRFAVESGPKMRGRLSAASMPAAPWLAIR